MWAVALIQAGMLVADVRTVIELGTIVFFGGTAWQQLRDLKQRLRRIEKKIFNERDE